MKTPTELGSARDIASALKRRVLSPTELVKWYLGRIARLDGQLRSSITVCADEALAAAQQAEKALMRGDVLPPLFGLPLGVKDQFWTRGVRTTSGSRTRMQFVPSEDATAVARLLAAGAILLSKLNMGELALGASEEPPWGHPANPWNRAHSSGESSSGPAVALAADLCAIALGEDTGGSARTPAAFCGVVGLRPTFGRVSRYGMTPMCWFMDAPAPMTRTVEDAAMLLQVIAGHDPRDPYSSRRTVPDYVARLPSRPDGPRIGLIKELFEDDILQDDARRAILDALDVLSALGARIRTVSIPLIRSAGPVFAGTALVEAAAANRDVLRDHSLDLDPATRMRLQAAALIPSIVNDRALRLRILLARQVLDVLRDVDVLACATAPYPAPRLVPVSADSESLEDTRRNYVSGHALVGIPVISVPCGRAGNGLPLGIQFAGRHFEEALVLRIAHAYQCATRWHLQRPDLGDRSVHPADRLNHPY